MGLTVVFIKFVTFTHNYEHWKSLSCILTMKCINSHRIYITVLRCLLLASFLLHILPAVHNNRSSVGWIDSFDLLEEFQHADGWEWHSEVWPAGKVKLGDQPGSSGTIAALLRSKDAQGSYRCINNALKAQISHLSFYFLQSQPTTNWYLLEKELQFYWFFFVILLFGVECNY